MVGGGDLVTDTVYHSASPWSSGNRSIYSDKYLRECGIEFMICLDDSKYAIAEYVEKSSDAYASSLFDEGKVTCGALHMSIHSYPHECEFVLDSIFKADGKVGIFCTKGKDRTGFHCAILEGLADVVQKVKDKLTGKIR